jgi:hypothetical protein
VWLITGFLLRTECRLASGWQTPDNGFLEEVKAEAYIAGSKVDLEDLALLQGTSLYES